MEKKIVNNCKGRVLVTGANGFIGQALCRDLIKQGFDVLGAVRNDNVNLDFLTTKVIIEDINNQTNWAEALINVDFVIHLAARVHIMNEVALDPIDIYRKTNVEGTLNLAKQASKIGVKRFIYLSSIKVNGEITLPGIPFTENDKHIPIDPYALSKYESERNLLQLAKETDLEVVIIRPPLVYGPNVKANFLSMVKWLHKGIPLPFGAIHNKRSLVALDNLVDLIITCVDHPFAVNEVFLVSDSDDISTTELLNRVAMSLGKKSRLLSLNQQILELCLNMVGKKDLTQRLCGSLQVDISKAKKLLNWKPPVSMDYELNKISQQFLDSQTT